MSAFPDELPIFRVEGILTFYQKLCILDNRRNEWRMKDGLTCEQIRSENSNRIVQKPFQRTITQSQRGLEFHPGPAGV